MYYSNLFVNIQKFWLQVIHMSNKKTIALLLLYKCKKHGLKIRQRLFNQGVLNVYLSSTDNRSINFIKINFQYIK